MGAALVVLASAQPAVADPCDYVAPPAQKWCREGDDGAGGGGGDGPPDALDDSPLDPLATVAKGVGRAAAWLVDRLSDAVDKAGWVDFTNGAFVKVYAVVFAASTVLTLLLWVWAVAKRAIRGAPMSVAFGEAIGFLWLVVMASAFTPLALYTVVSATDAVTDVLSSSGGGGDTRYFSAFSKALRADGEDGIGGGPVMRIVVALVSLAAAGVVFLELVVRAALLYVGGALAPLVYSGVVDRDLWGRVRRWAGIMAAVIMVRPVITIVLKLGSVISSGKTASGSVGAVVSGLAILILTIIASSMLFAFIPGMGDDVRALRRDAYDPASARSSAAVMRPARLLRQGIDTHAARDGVQRTAAASAGSGSSSSQPQNQTGSGMAAHASRPTRQTPPPPPAQPPAPQGQQRIQRLRGPDDGASGR